MNSYDNFLDWMIQNSKTFGENTAGHYAGGLKSTSQQMVEASVINKPLIEMTPAEYDIAELAILTNPKFVAKNKKGNNMYSNSLKQYRFYLAASDEFETEKLRDAERIQNDPNLSKTEREVLSTARLGQGTYRKNLIKKYSGRCVISGVDIQQVLIASHIKPWAVSTNSERISTENGLLLSSTYDRLFDRGLISFKHDGSLLISSMINEENKNILKLRENDLYELHSTPEMLTNLEYHRDVLFVK